MKSTHFSPFIDKTVAKAIIFLFEQSYRLGVIDAEEVDDANRCLHFIEKLRTPGIYGRVTSDFTCGWDEWVLSMVVLLRKKAFTTPLRGFFDALRTKSYHRCVAPISLEFYIKGLNDYNAAPHAVAISAFESISHVCWTRKGLTSWREKDIVEDMQLLSYNRIRIDEENPNKESFRSNAYRSFIMAVWSVLQKDIDSETVSCLA